MKNSVEVPSEIIENKIFLISGKKVMLDRDLAELYEVPTKRLNEQVKRNIKRFPDRFIFQLTEEEKEQLVANCDRFRPLKYSSSLPYAFTEHGVAMLASVLNSDRAIKVNIQIIDTFIKLREMLFSHKELREKIEAMERKYDDQFIIVFDAIKKLLEDPLPDQTPKRKIGFQPALE